MSVIRFLLGCVLVAATFALLEVGAFFNSARKTSEDAHSKLDYSTQRLVRFLDHADLTQREQSLYLQAEQNHLRKVTLPNLDTAIKKFGGAAGSLDALLANTDASLNRRPDGVLPTLQGTAISLDQGVQMFTTSTQPVIDESAKGAHAFEQAMTAVSDLAQDESWQHIPQNLDALTTSAMEASGNINATTVDVRQAVHNYIHPRWPIKLLGLLDKTTSTGLSALRLIF